jgi:CxxC-x17-CxxC domain-containing protein
MYPATCARCGQQTQVPFQPRGDRPVYCSNCFHSERTTLAPSRPSFAPSRVAVPAYADVPQEESRRERRPSRKPDRWERTDRLERYERPSRRTRDYLTDDDDV